MKHVAFDLELEFPTGFVSGAEAEFEFAIDREGFPRNGWEFAKFDLVEVRLAGKSWSRAELAGLIGEARISRIEAEEAEKSFDGLLEGVLFEF